MSFIACLHIFNNLIVLQQKLLPKILLFCILDGDLRNEFSHIVKNNVFVGRMKVRVERAIHKANMNLVLDNVKLLLKPFRSYFIKVLRNLSLAKRKYPLVLEVSTEWHFDKAFIRSHI